MLTLLFFNAFLWPCVEEADVLITEIGMPPD